MRRVTGFAAGAAIAATGLLTAGCLQGGASAAGGGSASNTPAPGGSAAPASGAPADQQAVAAAYGKTIAAGSARIASTTAIGLGDLRAPLNANGTISFTSGAVDMTEPVPGGQGAMAETRFVGDVLYARLPQGMAAQLAKGKPWISIQLGGANQGSGPLQQLFNDSPTDPSTVLGFLRGAGADVSNMGPATIDGSPTTHYQLTLDLDVASAGADPAGRQGIAVLEHELGTNKLPAQVWIDQTGRLRRISIQEALVGSSGSASASPTPTSQQSGVVSFTFVATFSDFGVPANITAPPPDQVTDLTNQLGGK